MPCPLRYATKRQMQPNISSYPIARGVIAQAVQNTWDRALKVSAGEMDMAALEERLKPLQALAALSPKDVTSGLTDFLALLRRNGIKTAVASSSAAAHVTAKRFGLFDKFDVFVDGESNLPNKPNPHLFLRAAQLLQTEPCNCVVFEDSINGLKAAKAAGMHSVGIQTYFTDMADKIIDDFADADLTLLQFDK